MRAPNGPAPRSALPEPRNRPVPIVPAICTNHNNVRTKIARAWGYTHSNHLDMALLQSPLDLVKVVRVEAIPVVGLDDIVLGGALLEGLAVLLLLIEMR